jgi:hypothetical protein
VDMLEVLDSFLVDLAFQSQELGAVAVWVRRGLNLNPKLESEEAELALCRP